MFFAAPVQNLTLPRSYRILTQHPILILGDPTPTGRGAPRPCYIGLLVSLLVVEGFSPRLSLLLDIPRKRHPSLFGPFWGFMPRHVGSPRVKIGY